MLWWFFQLEHAGRCHSKSTAFLAHRLDTSMQWYRSEVELSLEKTPMRISLGSRLTGGQHESSTCMSWKLGTPSEDWESLAPRKKSDSSLSAGAGEFVDEEDRESSRPELPAPDVIVAMVMLWAGRADGRYVSGSRTAARESLSWSW